MANLYKLPNGLEVLLEENHAAPVVSFYMLIKTGAAMETDAEAGISHIIEHMLFKGTPSRSVGEIAIDVETAGGEINAFTSFDQTVFYINMAARFCDKGLSILADAVQNPLFEADELEREKEVILEEIRRERDNPQHRVSELVFMKSFKRHPYGRPIIGFESTVKSFTRTSLINFYKKWYTPKNMALIVVGAFETEKMLKRIKNAFAGFRGGGVPKKRPSVEPEQKKIVAYTEENPINAAYFSLGFHIPNVLHKDIPALDVLSHILAGTESARLTQEIREKRGLVNAIYSYAFSPKDPGILIVGGVTTPAKTVSAINAIWDEIVKLKVSPAKSGELERAKLNIRSAEIYEKETTSGQANKYAYFMAVAGDHEFERRYYRALQDVRADDIMKVVQKYIVPQNLTLAIVLPKKSGKTSIMRRIRRHIKTTPPIKTTVKKLRGRPTPPILKTLPNGIRLLIHENHALPIVACASASLGGLRLENRMNNGINNLLANTITKGTQSKTALEIAEKIEAAAGTIDGYSGRNTFGVKAEFLSDKFAEGFDLFAEVLTQPSFAASEVAIEKRQALEDIKNQEDALTALAFIKFLAALFPTHPYGLRLLGKKDTVRKISREELDAYYRRIVTPKNTVVSVVGDVAPDEVVKLAEARLKFKNARRGVFKPPRPEVPNKMPLTVEYKRPEKEQTHIVMGFLGPTLKSKDHYAIAVLNNILSGQGGRLFLHLRDQMGLAYAVNSSYFAGIEPGFIALYIGTEPRKAEKAIKAMKGELAALLQEGVTVEELTRSKNHLIGTYEIERQKCLAMAGAYSCNILYGLGAAEVDEYPNKIAAVTRADVTRAAKRYIHPSRPVTAVIKPE